MVTTSSRTRSATSHTGRLKRTSHPAGIDLQEMLVNVQNAIHATELPDFLSDNSVRKYNGASTFGDLAQPVLSASPEVNSIREVKQLLSEGIRYYSFALVLEGICPPDIRSGNFLTKEEAAIKKTLHALVAPYVAEGYEERDPEGTEKVNALHRMIVEAAQRGFSKTPRYEEFKQQRASGTSSKPSPISQERIESSRQEVLNHCFIRFSALTSPWTERTADMDLASGGGRSLALATLIRESDEIRSALDPYIDAIAKHSEHSSLPNITAVRERALALEEAFCTVLNAGSKGEAKNILKTIEAAFQKSLQGARGIDRV